MTVVVFVGGVPNAGKTTIAAGLACSYPNTLFIDGDSVLSEDEENQTAKLEKKHQWVQKTDKIGQIVHEQVNKNMNVIVAWSLREIHYQALINSLPETVNFYYIFLDPQIEVLEQNRVTRPYTSSDKKYAIKMYDKGYRDQNFCSLSIDNSNETPFDTVKAIREEVLDAAFSK